MVWRHSVNSASGKQVREGASGGDKPSSPATKHDATNVTYPHMQWLCNSLAWGWCIIRGGALGLGFVTLSPPTNPLRYTQPRNTPRRYHQRRAAHWLPKDWCPTQSILPIYIGCPLSFPPTQKNPVSLRTCKETKNDTRALGEANPQNGHSVFEGFKQFVSFIIDEVKSPLTN